MTLRRSTVQRFISYPDDTAVTKCGVAQEFVYPKDIPKDFVVPPNTRPWHVNIAWVSTNGSKRGVATKLV